MKTEEKTGKGKIAQVVLRCSTERHGFYRLYYGFLTPDNTFAEESEVSFWDFLGSLEVPDAFVSIFLAGFDASEKEICSFGYLAQERFDELVIRFSRFCRMVQLYPGMLVLTFKEKGNEG